MTHEFLIPFLQNFTWLSSKWWSCLKIWQDASWQIFLGRQINKQPLSVDNRKNSKWMGGKYRTTFIWAEMIDVVYVVIINSRFLSEGVSSRFPGKYQKVAFDCGEIRYYLLSRENWRNNRCQWISGITAIVPS